ncbi:MAG: NAD(P)-dependent oxidoreductase [Candidatus Margulisiibacteriota bacterium]
MGLKPLTLLITGSTGFVGSHLIRQLNALGHHSIPVTRTHANPHDLEAMIQSNSIDGIIHLASHYVFDHGNADQIPTLIASNIELPTLLLDIASRHKIKWFINTGTFLQYYDGLAYNPVNLYAATKQAFETMMTYYTKTSSLQCTTIVLHNTFGPEDTRPKLFNLWAESARTGKRLTMSPGFQWMDMNYIDNVVDAYVALITLLETHSTDITDQIFTVRAEKRVTLKALAQLFSDVTGLTPSIEWGASPYRDRETMIPWEAGIVVPGWTPRVSLEEGIRRTFGERKA